MDDDALALGDHAGDQGPVEPDCGEEVEVQLLLPLLVGESGKAARGGRGTAQHVDEDVEAAEVALHRLHHGLDASLRGQVGLDEGRAGKVGGPGARPSSARGRRAP